MKNIDIIKTIKMYIELLCMEIALFFSIPIHRNNSLY